MTAPAKELPTHGKTSRRGFHALENQSELPAGWRWVRLGEVCAINPSRPAALSRADSEPTSFVPMDAVDAVSGSISRPLLRPFGEIKKGYTCFVEGDVLFAKITPCMQNGKHAIARGLTDGIGFGTTEFHVLRPAESVLSEWVHFFVRQPEFLNKATEQFTGAIGQQRLPPGYLETHPIPLPPLAEQKRIAARLREQMAAAEKARAATQARLEAAHTLPAACLRSVFDGPEAAQWPLRPLGEVLVPHKEIIHPGDRQSGTATFVGLEHIESDTGRRIGEVSVDLAHLTGRKPTFRRGQIVYGYLRPYLNKVWIAEFDGVSSVDQFAYEVRSDLADVRFVAWFMRSPTYMRRSQVLTTTGQLPRIGTGEIAAVEIGLPSLDVQRAVVDEIDRRFAAHQRISTLLSDEAEAIERMPSALLRQAFSGEQ